MQQRNFYVAFYIAIIFVLGCGDDSETTINQNNPNNTILNNDNASLNNDTSKSGVPPRKTAENFTGEDEDAFCDYMIELWEEVAGVYVCDADYEIELVEVSRSECESTLAELSDCPVSKLEACFEANYQQQQDPCEAGDSVPPACQELDMPACGEGSTNNTNNMNNTNNNPNNMNNTNNNPNNMNNTNNNPNSGERGDSCKDPDSSGEPENRYASLIGNTAGCSFDFDQTLACIYDVGSGDGTCEYRCSESEEGMQGSCPDGLACINSGKETIAETFWYLCN